MAVKGNPMKQVFAVAVVASIAVASGCATAPPGTPGAGVGAAYTPVIDMQGLDMRRYSSDIEGCRQYAYRIDPAQASINAGIGEAIFSGAMMAALGGRGRSVGNSANAGMLRGLDRGQGRALSKQELIITNCMAGRGYRTLDAGYVTSSGPSPYGPAQLPTQAAAGLPAPIAEASVITVPNVAPAGSAMPPPIPGAEAPNTPFSGPPIGKDAHQAEHLSAAKACNVQPSAVLSAKGPGFETYMIACTNGDTLAVRCEFGNCRALR